ncbi:DUF2529 family protein [Lottiidibacillus patelloidae]|uniref:DUF2529 family protein n=1 Tax=Lottiidibacillus patelloidae TaxID=2670334 RepID=UPI0013035BB2|nr:DUF2529 family protein [Lottiidibacillus patelloidae]
MLKIFTTQLVGYFNSIQEKEEIHIEDSSRAIAQAIVGDGHVYFHGFHEMMAVCYEAVLGQETLPKAKFLFEGGKKANLTSIDRLVIAASPNDHTDAISLAKEAKEQGVTVIGLSVEKDHGGNDSFISECDFHINIHLNSPLVPTDSGERICTPTVMAALYGYYALFLTTKEILDDYL